MIINANALHIPIASGSVQTVVTSPPYYGLRDYGVSGQLGLEQTPDAYIASMVAVFREVKRVLRDDGTLWLNVGDSYAGSNKGLGADGTQYPGEKQQTSRAWKIDKGKRTLPRWGGENVPATAGLKTKDLIGIPWRLAFALQADGAADPAHMQTIQRVIAAITASYDSRNEWPDRIRAEIERLEVEWLDAHRGGWYLRSDIIWSKPNPMPESVTDRPTRAHEYLFLLTKSPRYYYDADAIKEDGSGRSSGLKNYKSDGLVGHETKGGILAVSDVEWHTRNRRTVWTIATQPTKEAHFATFPEKLVEPCILAGTSEKGCCPKCGKPWERVIEKTGHVNKREDAHVPNNTPSKIDSTGWAPTSRATENWIPGCACDAGEPVPCVVLDPFAGSGTVERVAIRLRRRSIGTELNYHYISEIVPNRTADIQPVMFIGAD